MPLLKKIEIKAASHPKTKNNIVRSSTKTSNLDPVVIKKTIEELYRERGILVVSFYGTNLKNFKVSEDGKFAIELDYENKIFLLYQYPYSIDLLCGLEDFVKTKDADVNHYSFNETSPNAAMSNLSDDLMRILAARMEEKIKQENEQKWEAENAKAFNEFQDELDEEWEGKNEPSKEIISNESPILDEKMEKVEAAIEPEQIQQQEKRVQEPEAPKVFGGFKLNLNIGGKK